MKNITIPNAKKFLQNATKSLKNVCPFGNFCHTFPNEYMFLQLVAKIPNIRKADTDNSVLFKKKVPLNCMSLYAHIY